MAKSPWLPTRVVTVTLTAVFDESDSLDDEELVDVATEKLMAAAPEGYHVLSTSGHVTSITEEVKDKIR